MVSVYRVHIKPTGGTKGVNYEQSYELCLRNNVIGFGWKVTEKYSAEPIKFRDYMESAEATYRGDSDNSMRTAVNRLNAMEPHDLAWIRSPNPFRHESRCFYHLCRIVGPWDYRDSAEYLAWDIVNVRPVEIIEINEDDLPKGLETRFQRGSVIEPIKTPALVDGTIQLWKRYHEAPIP